MSLLDKTLEEFVQLFQGSSTYFGASQPIGSKKPNGKNEFNIGLNQNQ